MLKEYGVGNYVDLSEIERKITGLGLGVGFLSQDDCVEISGKKPDVFKAVRIIQNSNVRKDVRIIIKNTDIDLILTSEKIQSGWWRSVFRRMPTIPNKISAASELPKLEKGERVVLSFDNIIDNIIFSVGLKKATTEGFLMSNQNIRIAQYEIFEKGCKIFFSVNKRSMVYIERCVRLRTFTEIKKII